MSSVRSLTTGSVLMLAVRFEEVVSRGAGAAVALFSGAVIREMYRTKILSVKVSGPNACHVCCIIMCCTTFLCAEVGGLCTFACCDACDCLSQ